MVREACSPANSAEIDADSGPSTSRGRRSSNASTECVFDKEDRKVVVSESGRVYIDPLRPTRVDVMNPLASGRSKFLTDSTGRRQVPLNVDGQAVKLDWPSSREVIPKPTADIPSLDHALYLTNTVKFHLGQTYHLFDENDFMSGLHDFYRNGTKQEPTTDTRLWYIQFLLVMAFGKALLVPGAPGQSPPGSGLFSRALELLPDNQGLYQDPILSMEILCCLALYLQSVDHRNSAFTYIGQAFRIALTQGLHCEPSEGLLSETEANRLRCIWWTIYILDRKLSSLMGAPSSIQDSDITVTLPLSEPINYKYKALGLHVALSQLHAKVLSTVYGADGKLEPSFLKKIQEVLRDMARLAPQLTAGFEFKFDNYEPASRISATLNLSYHQCVVLATRPLLICLLQDVLARQDAIHRDLAGPIKALLSTSSESASKSLRILSTLQSQHLLETFLSFDLEQTFSSGFILTLMTAIPGLPNHDSSYLDTAFSILSTIIAHGNMVALYRKEELEKLQEILHLVQTQTKEPPAPKAGGQPLSNVNRGLNPSTEHTERVTATGAAANGLASSEEMLSIAGLLDWEPEMSAYGNTQLSGSWLWTDAITQDLDFSGDLL
ncbi:hypothetical protein J7T55_005938 [Diaporthe amygdali]|uniref:uncharacterized protein n=1 Tax=Phomopsis amygdali TaxID=1214568 RepID=UPI0022FF4317|nr:uncharacterized protein J7T55_005938 [Diaporthe amygdali]KAJ0124599.1 hypothetical protein J7T55_005938 [Diaporthe amygdali]